MDLKVSNESTNALVVEVRENSLDASNIREFRDILEGLLKNRKSLVFDLSGVHFVDSSGLGALIACQRTLNEHQGELRICSMRPEVLSLFELTRMHRVFHIHASPSDALKALNARNL